MRLFQITTYDTETLWVNLDQVAMIKLHPSSTKPKSGMVVLSGGKELFPTLDSYYALLKVMQDAVQTQQETIVPKTAFAFNPRKPS